MAAPILPLIEESALVIGREIGRGANGIAYAAVLNGSEPVCAKVRPLLCVCGCVLPPLRIRMLYVRV